MCVHTGCKHSCNIGGPPFWLISSYKTDHHLFMHWTIPFHWQNKLYIWAPQQLIQYTECIPRPLNSLLMTMMMIFDVYYKTFYWDMWFESIFCINILSDELHTMVYITYDLLNLLLYNGHQFYLKLYHQVSRKWLYIFAKTKKVNHWESWRKQRFCYLCIVTYDKKLQ